ncbi:alpha/beta hydrolase [Mesorhizobium sp. IMUNJ 23232]|uniref:alpha/beta hydrolase n=1 Tax=Mesorhizobium sp. IMUNJ 23232 TaxID=3376064 RepID=UPI00379778B7
MIASSFRRVTRHVPKVLLAIASAVLGAIAAVLIIAVIVLNSKPDLSVWHLVHLDEEFTKNAPVTSLEGYLALEDRLFAQLQSDVYARIDDAERTEFNRYNAGSRSDPAKWPQNWNHTYQLTSDAPAFGVLMLHGYSDSPYSLRTLARQLHEEGGEVLGLRIPGHGTAPSALIQTTFADMAAAVRIGMKHVAGKMGGKPIFIVGYSNGGALATHYALASVEDPTLPQPAGIVLISPEIGIARIAAYSDWQARLGDLLGLDKLAWNAVQPEYDPYKYNSFAVNAGYQAYQATVEIQSQLDRLEKQGRLAEVPPILAFQSAADATVEAQALLTKLFDRLKPGAHQLVVFDVNRMYAAQGLLKASLDVESLLTGPPRSYRVSILTNRDSASTSVVVRDRPASETATTATEPGLSWPAEVYSLSHIALPFPPDDPLYGEGDGPENPGIRLGRLDLRGENRTLAIPNTAMTRQHWNPFFSFLSDRAREFVNTPAR